MHGGAVGFLTLHTLDVDHVLLPVHLDNFADLLSFVVPADHLKQSHSEEQGQETQGFEEREAQGFRGAGDAGVWGAGGAGVSGGRRRRGLGSGRREAQGFGEREAQGFRGEGGGRRRGLTWTSSSLRMGMDLTLYFCRSSLESGEDMIFLRM